MRIFIIASIAASLAISATAQETRHSMPRFVDGKQIVDTPTPVPQAQPVMVPMQPGAAMGQNPSGVAPDAPARLDQPRREQPAARSESANTSERRTPRPEAKKEETKREEKKTTEKSESSKKTEKSDETDKDASTVSAVDAATSAIGEFLRASNDGMYSTAEEYLTPHLRDYFKHEISAATGGLKAVADQITRDGRIRRVIYSNWRGRGEGGRLDVELTYNLGTEEAPRMVSESRTFELQKVNKKWYVIIPVVPGPMVDGMVNGQATEVTPDATPAPTPAATPAPPPSSDPTPVAPGGGTASAAAGTSPTTPGDARTTTSALDGLPW